MADSREVRKLQERVSETMGNDAEKLIISQMQYIGETCVKIARSKEKLNDWKDRTGNLRSSIGYTITIDGKIVHTSGFKSTDAPHGNGSEGAAEGRRFIASIMPDAPRSIVLTVAAGMHYAQYVEEIHHKDVLASANIEGERIARKLLAQLFAKQNEL